MTLNKMSHTKRCWIDGITAFQEGRKREDNPHVEGVDRESWDEGFHLAETILAFGPSYNMQAC